MAVLTAPEKRQGRIGPEGKSRLFQVGEDAEGAGPGLGHLSPIDHSQKGIPALAALPNHFSNWTYFFSEDSEQLEGSGRLLTFLALPELGS